MKDSRISWTDHTYNPWIGCTKVSPGCERCYAERQAPRHGVEWGPHGERRRAAPSTLRQPFDWSRQAAKARRPAFVFCASLADVFDNKADPAWRAELFETIRGTPWLVWLLLTKRPQNIRAMLPPDWGEGYSNVWLGVSVENQEEAERRVPVLLEVPARLRFVSAEPLLEEVTLAPWLGRGRLEWVICGAESGPGRRPFQRDWARRLRDECGAAG